MKISAFGSVDRYPALKCIGDGINRMAKNDARRICRYLMKFNEFVSGVRCAVQSESRLYRHRGQLYVVLKDWHGAQIENQLSGRYDKNLIRHVRSYVLGVLRDSTIRVPDSLNLLASTEEKPGSSSSRNAGHTIPEAGSNSVSGKCLHIPERRSEFMQSKDNRIRKLLNKLNETCRLLTLIRYTDNVRVESRLADQCGILQRGFNSAIEYNLSGRYDRVFISKFKVYTQAQILLAAGIQNNASKGWNEYSACETPLQLLKAVVHEG